MEVLTASMKSKGSAYSQQLAQADPANFLKVLQQKFQLMECSTALQKFLQRLFEHSGWPSVFDMLADLVAEAELMIEAMAQNSDHVPFHDHDHHVYLLFHAGIVPEVESPISLLVEHLVTRPLLN